jgi:hypothetical protein
MFCLLQCFWNQGQGERRSGVMNTTYNIKKPFFCPDSFASGVLSAKWFIIKVRWKGRMVSQPFPFRRNRFLCSRDNHVEIVVQFFLSRPVIGVSLKGSAKKSSNGSPDPVKKEVVAGKQQGMGRVKIECKEFPACELNSRQNFPHVRDVENIKKLLTMLDSVWCP